MPAAQKVKLQSPDGDYLDPAKTIQDYDLEDEDQLGVELL